MTESLDLGLEAESSYGRLKDAFHKALGESADPVTTEIYAIAGRPARVRIVGRELARVFGRSLAHLRLPGDPDTGHELRIDVWDESAAGVRRTGWEAPQPAKQGFHVACASSDGRFVLYEVSQTRAVLDRVGQHLVAAVGSATELTHYEKGRPLLPPVLLWLMDRGIYALHGALVARQGRGVLLGGPSGAGKSTTAVVCAEAGFDYLADDCVALERQGDGRFIGHSLYGSANIEADHLQRLGSFAAHGIRGRVATDEKSLLLLSDLIPSRVQKAADIRAVVLPRVTPTGPTSTRPASKVEALLRLAPSSAFIFPHVRGVRGAFDALVPLVESLPTYWLDLGPDLPGIPRSLDEILSRSTGS